jgi:flavin reductase (DIM6/NTAB) family NADH-FMN oxidoreductase RutF
MKETCLDRYSNKALEMLPKGAFLTTSDGDKRVNTMTISWGSIGHIWNKPIFMVMVRPSRYSFELIEHHPEFTVSFSVNNRLKNALALCGTQSGRDINKFEQANLHLQAGKEVNVPVIEECELHYECKVVHKQVMVPEFFNESYDGKWYPEKDYHTMYYGEIVACYTTQSLS